MVLDKSMTSTTVIATLRAHRDALARLYVGRLSLFGSHARGSARSDSDVDLVVAFDGAATFDRYMDLKFYLEDLLGCKVDLVTEAAIRPEMREQILREALRVA